MRIKCISCTQFAGIRDRRLSLNDGINLIYGKNESGKSTLVNLLSRTLFQNAVIDGRSDKEFKELYFPGARKGSKTKGDFANGEVTFDTENGTYTLSKEWGSDSRCFLSTPDGVIREQRKIDAILKDVLLYGEGVYSDMLFSSQRNTASSLQTILDASKKTDAKQEITNAVSQAFSESDGITADVVEQAIQKKIDDIAGKHWDIERWMPVRKAGRWTNSLGEILKAYYDLEDAKAVLEKITLLEKEVDTAATDYFERNGAARAAEAAYDRFHTFAGHLILQSERNKTIDRLQKEIAKFEGILTEWPQLTYAVEKATALKTEKECRELLEKYESASKLSDEIEALQRDFCEQACPTSAEIADVKAAQREIAMLENKLCGMNLNAAVKMLGSHTLSLTSLRTGQALDVADDSISITEAVKIIIPGVMEMQLSPANVDIPEIETAIAEQKKTVSTVFSRYAVESLDALEQLAKKISDGKAKMEMLSERLSMVLGGEQFIELKAAAETVTTEARSIERIDQDILALCGNSEIVKYITAKETIIQGYVNEYTSIDLLKAKAYETGMELKHAQESVTAAQDIPAEYANISDPESHLTLLQNELKRMQSARENALTTKTTAVGKLESYKENCSGDPVADVETAERIFDEKKAFLRHWMHIADVFARQKLNVQNNPMHDISNSFTHYLDLISDGSISAEFPNHEQLNMSIYSGNNLLDYGKLSDGTKETVSLAFRLAVLDHLFPGGGGIIVLDDPFNDMDANRTAQSCKLVKECAKRHQVIFLTCKEGYADMLGEKAINI